MDYKQPGLFKHRNNKDYNMTINSTYLVIMTHDYNELNTKKVKHELGFESLNQPLKIKNCNNDGESIQHQTLKWS